MILSALRLALVIEELEVVDVSMLVLNGSTGAKLSGGLGRGA